MKETNTNEYLTNLACRLARVVQLCNKATGEFGDLSPFFRLCQEAESALGDKAKFAIRKVKVDAVVRYPEDAVVNGQYEDNDKPTMPFLSKRKSEYGSGEEWVWSIVIDAENGVVLGWPTGTIARIFYKVCDECRVELDNGIVRDEYVPDFLAIDDSGYGDYVYLTIDGDGKIQNWKQKNVEDWAVEYVKSKMAEV